MKGTGRPLKNIVPSFRTFFFSALLSDERKVIRNPVWFPEIKKPDSGLNFLSFRFAARKESFSGMTG